MENKLMHFKVDRENLTGILNGAGIVVLSIMMAFFDNEIASIVLRDILMILILGFFVPLYFIVIVHKKSVAVL